MKMNLYEITLPFAFFQETKYFCYVTVSARNKNIKIKCKQAMIFLSSPVKLSQRKVQNILLSAVNELRQYFNHYEKNGYFYWNPKQEKGFVFLQGAKYLLEKKNNQTEPFGAHCYSKTITCSESFADPQLMQKALYAYGSKFYNYYINKKMKVGAQKMNVTAYNIYILPSNMRNYERHWGSCHKKENGESTLKLNVKLMHFAEDILDYVIVHELAHLLYPHHQATFGNYVALYYANYQTANQQLKKYSFL